MYTHNKIDNKHLDKVRHYSTYNPFSFKFDAAVNNKLLEKAKKEGASPYVLNIISAGPFFHDRFFLPIGQELKEIYDFIGYSKLDLAELFVASVNNQYILIQQKFDEYMEDKKIFSAQELTHATFTLSSSPDNPQGFTSNAEGFVDHVNELLNYLLSPYCEDKKTKQQHTVGILNASIIALQNNVNRFHGIKNHYETSLYYNGDIDVTDTSSLFFDSTTTELNSLQTTAFTMMQNQRIKKGFSIVRQHDENRSIQQFFKRINFKRILDRVTERAGFLTYELRLRREDEIQTLVESFVAADDYYPFYADEPLQKLNYLTITEIIRIHAELCHLIYTYVTNVKFTPEEKSLKEFKNLFLPRIKKSVLLSYLTNITNYPEKKLEAFVNLLTTVPRRGIDVYATPLIMQNDYYFFPFLPLHKPNYYFLIDHWLEAAEIDLEHRGPLFEKFCKEKLQKITQNEFNKFKVINRNKFDSNEKFEEIDLVIETKESVIVAELKCVKYPMNERDLYNTLSKVIASTGCEQVTRKANFLVNNASEFIKDINLEGKNIIKVVVTNFPVFPGTKINDIAVTDMVTFLAYFQTNKMTYIQDDLNSPIDKKDIAFYYNSEKEFCNNLEDYICNNPLINLYNKSLKVQEVSYEFDKDTRISYKTIIADQENFNIDVKSILTEENGAD